MFSNELQARLYKSLGPNGGYQDLGLVIDATNVPAGATAWSNWFDDMSWVRNMVFITHSDQQYELLIQRRDSSQSADSGTGSLKAAISASTIFSNVFTPQNTTSGGGITGKSFKIGAKNSSASPNTFAKIRLQLMGV